MELFFIGLIIGIIFGAFAMYKKNPNIGKLMVSFDDVEHNPYLFLNLKTMDPIYKNKFITLTVDLKTCNPQK